MDDLIAEFVAETEDSLNDLDVELVRLEQDPGDKEILGNIFRIMHTIKGTCGFLGLSRLESVAHAAENILGKIRDGEMAASEEAVSLILEALDRIKELLSALQESGGEPSGEDSELIGRLHEFCEHGGTASSVPDEVTLPEPAVPEEMPVSPEGPSEPAAQEGTETDGYVTLDDLEAAFAAAPGPDDGEAPFFPDVESTISGAARESAIIEGLNIEKEEPKPAKHPVPVPHKAAVVEKKADKQPEADAETATVKSVAPAANTLIRVNLGLLESMMQMVSELVLTRNQLLQVMRSREDEELAGPMQRLNYITSELQDNVMQTRMQPISNAWTKFPRLVRDLAHELGKKINLHMEGEETELDRQVLEMIKDPLTHMVRNSADHGLETPDKRKAAGKPEAGTITLRAYHEGGHIIIEINDDGNGIPVDKVKAKCVANGLTTEAQLEQMSDRQIIQYIFQAGFSTAEKVTSVSGRGVGMDVVRSNIEKIGGTVEVRSQQGKGSSFMIKIPLTLAIVSILIVEVSGKRFAVPQINVQEIVRVAPEGGEYAIETLNDTPVLRLRDELLPVLYLDALMNLTPTEGRRNRRGFIAVCRVGGQSFGLMIDRVYDTEEIVVKPMAPALRGIPLYSGSTILGDGSVILILDPNGLARQLAQVELHDGAVQEQISLEQRVQQRTNRFLLFRAGNNTPKAVSLDMVSRLEEIDAQEVEYSSGRPVLQYRGSLMQLITLDGTYDLPKEGIMEVIVFQYSGHAIGLYVEGISDIVDFVYDIKMSSREEWCLGSTIINDSATDVVDVGYLILQATGEDPHFDVSNLRPAVEHSPRVLLVEDSPFFTQLIIPVLEDAGYEVTASNAAEKALSLLKHQTFDLIVTDIEMPEMNGLEFAMACRGRAELQDIPIIAFTSKAAHTINTVATQAGINAVASKTDRESLLHYMREYLTERAEVT